MFLFFFFNDPATTEIYTLSLHDALPIYVGRAARHQHAAIGAEDAGHPEGDLDGEGVGRQDGQDDERDEEEERLDRKSTRLNSSHMSISYAVFCLKKKKKKKRKKNNYKEK